MKTTKRSILLLVLFLGLGAIADHTENWEQVNFDIWQDATDWSNADYLRSVGSIDSSKVIENFKLGDDGFMYVGVVRGGELQGYFRYLYDFTVLPGGPTDPFGDPLNNIPPTFDPPGGDSWYDPNLDYRDIAWTPEPEAYTAAFGAALVGVGLWLRHGRRHSIISK